MADGIILTTAKLENARILTGDIHFKNLSETILHLKNELLAEFIAGLYDANCSVYGRKGVGSNCIDFTTCSEELARQLQLILMRYEIQAKLRKRKASPGIIKSKNKTSSS